VPARLVDTRVSSPFPPQGKLFPADGLLLTFPDPTIGSMVLNVTVTEPSAPGNITAFPADGAQVVPLSSNLNFVPGLTVANQVQTRVPGGTRMVAFYNSAGFTHLVIDAFGYFTSTSSTVIINGDGEITPLGDVTRLGTVEPAAPG
jgi:hypothetical protein